MAKMKNKIRFMMIKLLINAKNGVFLIIKKKKIMILKKDIIILELKTYVSWISKK